MAARLPRLAKPTPKVASGKLPEGKRRGDLPRANLSHPTLVSLESNRHIVTAETQGLRGWEPKKFLFFERDALSVSHPFGVAIRHLIVPFFVMAYS